jgi:hypothetical protein
MGGFAGILQVTSFAFCWDSRFDLLFSWLLPHLVIFYCSCSLMMT